MTTHFLGKYEIELKFKIKDISEFRGTLLSLHPEAFVFENNEYDIYYDDPLASLHKRNMSMVLRSMSPSGIKLWIVKDSEERRCEAALPELDMDMDMDMENKEPR
ncbi:MULTISPECIES: CYTH domain-containing protein [Symbiopectobacterium]|uniref:CYTH domain-containing protein n=1 Tax=Symbiopectobacterium TaxID=801 RepID=UPI001A362366|nr:MULTISPECIES: CYTH domain-containing protein [Symbiopectobacterium]MBG6247710.1 CYTH domain-containing protein [Candidatus Symbiopectobacterium sp. PLON1]MBT9429259.1 CYTH domain-containing protein [Candidatus Symbiopectobacterium endolongispinus]